MKIPKLIKDNFSVIMKKKASHVVFEVGRQLMLCYQAINIQTAQNIQISDHSNL